MGKRLVADKNGRIPLSPGAQDLYDFYKPRMGFEWRHWEWMIREAKDSGFVAVQDRVTQMVKRRWLESKYETYEPTGRQRRWFRLCPEHVTFFCAECQEWKLGHNEYLCEECRGA
jgi:hypothetical protein